MATYSDPRYTYLNRKHVTGPAPAAGDSDSTVAERRAAATLRTMQRIAELQIARYDLDCTVDEYIARVQEGK